MQLLGMTSRPPVLNAVSSAPEGSSLAPAIRVSALLASEMGALQPRNSSASIVKPPAPAPAVVTRSGSRSVAPKLLRLIGAATWPQAPKSRCGVPSRLSLVTI
jgi:hypothetical protein